MILRLIILLLIALTSIAWTKGNGTSSDAHQSAGTTIVVTTAGVVEVDNVYICGFGTDNLSTTSGTTNDHTTAPSSTHGNTWIKALEETRANGSEDDGCTISLWYTKVTTEISASTTLTFTTPSQTNKTIICQEFILTTSTDDVTIQDSNGVNFGNSIQNVQINGMPTNEYLMANMICMEHTSTNFTPENGYAEYDDWSNSTTSGGQPATNLGGKGMWLIFTGENTTSNAGSSNADHAQVLVAFRETAGGGPTGRTRRML